MREFTMKSEQNDHLPDILYQIGAILFEVKQFLYVWVTFNLPLQKFGISVFCV